MIVGIGCDIVEHLKTELLKWGSNTKVLSRVFSAHELEIFQSKKDKKYISGRFAAKEAILKCLGTGMRDGISLNDVQILQTENGKPYVELCGEVKDIADEQGISQWHLSITHSENFSMAVAMAESKVNI